MLAKRIIPCLDIKEGRVVKGVKFLGLRDAGDPVEVAKVYDEQGADELVFLDITASFEKRKTLIELVERIAQNIFMPFTVGGGIADIQDIRNLLNAGAEKVSINTSAVKWPELLSQAAAKFGSQCIVVAIDAKRIVHPRTDNVNLSGSRVAGSPESIAGSKEKKDLSTTDFPHQPLGSCGTPRSGERLRTHKWEVYINGGRTPTALDALEWAKNVAALGAGEILLTSMDYDGTKDGYDLDLTKAVSSSVDIPVIASGGAGTLEHFYEVITESGADACLAASLFHYQECSLRQVKEYLNSKGVRVRL